MPREPSGTPAQPLSAPCPTGAQPRPNSKDLTLEGSREGATSLQGPALGQARARHLTYCLCKLLPTALLRLRPIMMELLIPF